MVMDVERQGGGHWAFKLGTAEKWIASGVVALLSFLAVYIFTSITSQLEEQGSAIRELATQQAVTNNQLVTLNLQLADVPSITRKMAEHDVRIDRLESDVAELRGTRGLK